ncbi:MAG: exo-alpha-sialidase [Clostridia bacterium]|nr:exo-alpha-sialidase [Clostridia bacterium]
MKHFLRFLASGIVIIMILTTVLSVLGCSGEGNKKPNDDETALSSDVNDKENVPGFEYEDLIKNGNVKYYIEKRSEVFRAPKNTWGTGCGYPTVIQLEHNGDNNGILLMSFSVADSGKGVGPTKFRIYESDDLGEKWKEIASVKEKLDTSIEACWQPCLFELPEALGDFPAGTILLAGVSIDPGQKIKSHIALYASQDAGMTWKEVSVIAEGGGLELGVWEPHLIYESGFLYSFYADDRGNGTDDCDQAIVYQRSSDGIHWEEKVGVVCPKAKTHRPGMPVITKMGNGKYFLVYEYGKGNGVPIYYKITDDIATWNEEDVGKQIKATSDSTIGSAPFCLWTPAGGENGTLIVTGKYGSNEDNKIFVSYDYGQSFKLIRNPLPYENRASLGYHPSFFASNDGSTVFYANAVENGDVLAKIVFARIRIIKEQ